jgi:hypothetical protein
MSFFKKTDIDEVNKKIEEAVESEFDTVYRPKLKDGVNVFWMLPMGGNMIEPYLFRLVHYNPFHICGRGDLTVDPKDAKSLTGGKKFSDCDRCITAWNLWEEHDRPKEGPIHQAFKANMAVKKCIIQVVEFSPFFKYDQGSNAAVLDTDIFDAHFENFKKLLMGEITEDELPEGFPEAIKESALAGVGHLLLNTEAGLDIRKEHRGLILDLEDEDPLLMPDKYLLSIYQGNSDRSFTGRGGKKLFSKVHDVQFTKPRLIKGWKLDKKFIKFVDSQAQDISNITPKEDTLEAKVDALQRLSGEELATLLKSSGHSYIATDENSSEPVKEVAPQSTESAPGAFDYDENLVIDSASKGDLAKLREKYDEL